MADKPLFHDRYQQQAVWTRSIRQYLLNHISLPQHATVLEIGCGTGVILKDSSIFLHDSQLVGIDVDMDSLRFASTDFNEAHYAQCNAGQLPFPNNTFDMVFCHYFLLWAQPLKGILTETIRIMKPGAWFITFAEPDYGARIDFPPELSSLGAWQEQSLQQQGAHTRIGRELGIHLIQMGLSEIEAGVLGGEWQYPILHPENDTETAIFQHDLNQLIDASDLTKQEMDHYLQIDLQSRIAGTRLIYVPTFYGKGRKP